VRVTRAGKVSPLTDSRWGFDDLRLSPDGRKVALDLAGANNQVWIYDLERNTLRPQTLRFNNLEPIWSPDGTRLTLGSDREGSSVSIFWDPVDGSGSAERLATKPHHWLAPRDWTADGKTLLFQDYFPPRGVWALSLEGDRQPRPVLQAPFNQWQARLSPSGRRLAYVSDESGRDEVYVSPFPTARGRTLVSTDGGSIPVWSRNGRELFFREGDRMMAVTVATEGAFTATKPRPLFEKALVDNYSSQYDVTPDGDFLMIEPGESDAPQTQINVVLNWLQELRPHATAPR